MSATAIKAWRSRRAVRIPVHVTEVEDFGDSPCSFDAKGAYRCVATIVKLELGRKGQVARGSERRGIEEARSKEKSLRPTRMAVRPTTGDSPAKQGRLSCWAWSRRFRGVQHGLSLGPTRQRRGDQRAELLQAASCCGTTMNNRSALVHVAGPSVERSTKNPSLPRETAVSCLHCYLCLFASHGSC